MAIVKRKFDSDGDSRTLALRGMGLGWLRKGNIKQAIISMRKAIDENPSQLSAYLDLGNVLFQQRRWLDLSDLCEQGLGYFLECPELHKLRIVALENHPSLPDAISVYKMERRDNLFLSLSGDEILCCTTVRNERKRLPWFFDYYRRLGVDRFFFIDNGSDDGTDEWLLQQPDVHLWSSGLAFNLANFGSVWFEVLLSRYGNGHWCLTVDVDEFLLFKGAPERTLQEFCRYLNSQNKLVATGLLLDFYSDKPISDTIYKEMDDPLKCCPYFDQEFAHVIQENTGHYQNQTLFYGGVRHRVFDSDHGFILSKAPLVKYEADIILTPGQHLTNISADQIAKEQICLSHFKFLASFPDYVRSESEREVHSRDAEHYKIYHDELLKTENLCLYNDTKSVRYQGVEQLLQLGVMLPEGISAPVNIPVIDSVAMREAERPSLSIMITIFDRVDNIERVLGSVLDEVTEDVHIEVICDFSSKEQQAKIRDAVCAIGDKRINFYALENRAGHPDIFNVCIERAIGKWVHILHDDDWVEPGFYAAVTSAISKSVNFDIVFCQSKNHVSGDSGCHVWTSYIERETPGVIEDWLARIATECRVQFSTIVVRRSVYEQLGGFCAAAQSAFDWEMWIRIAAKYQAYYIPEMLVNVDRSPLAETSSLQQSGKQLKDALAAINIALKHLPKEHVESIQQIARDQLMSQALGLVYMYQKSRNYEAAYAILKVVLEENPSQKIRKKLLSVVRGQEHAFSV